MPAVVGGGAWVLKILPSSSSRISPVDVSSTAFDESLERVLRVAQPFEEVGGFRLYRTADWLLGSATLPLAWDLTAASQQIYVKLLQTARDWHLARIWNYVPDINGANRDGLENYRAFCCGRSQAFEQWYGGECRSFIPAASAVGRKNGGLGVVFAASRRVPRHVENPLQVPAYDYPADYGPRSPSFARASVVSHSSGSTVFISGTAAIRGHATMAPENTREQLACTIENLREIGCVAGLGSDLGKGGETSRYFKVYLRHAADQPAVAAALEAQLLGAGATVTYVQADICRRALMVEIEATIWRPATV